MKKTIEEKITLSANTIVNSKKLSPNIEKSIKEMIKCLRKGKKIILFGNGGSAADAQHIASELMGRFRLERRSLPAIALTTDSSIITSIANDYSYDDVFSRQCDGLISKGDIAIGISTSGNSINVQKGIIMAKKKGATTIGLLGNNGGKVKNYVDISIIVNSKSTALIQEVHRVIYHIMCDIIEQNFKSKKN